MLQYLLDLKKTGKIFHLITHEQESFQIPITEVDTQKKELEANNIFWYPINYHNGKFLLLKKLYDFIKSFIICLRIKFQFKCNTILGFLPIAGGYSAIIATVLRLKLIVYCFEPHSEYMADFNIWSRKSLKFLLLKKFEREQLEIAKEIIVPTSYTAKLVQSINPYANVYTFPISIDTEQNVCDKDKRKEFRKEWGIGDKKVIFYMGKFGGIYYDIPSVLKFLNQFSSDSNFHVLLVSPDKNEIDNFIANNKYDLSFYTVINSVPYDILNQYISVADIGIVAVPPLPSQIYRTPVKTGLYLSCGIPYIINKGIAEDDLIAIENKVGIVLDDFTNGHTDELKNQMKNLWEDSTLSHRCRETAVRLRSHKKAIEILEQILND